MGSGYFWLKSGVFSTFWQFSVKSGDAERDLKPVAMLVDAGDPWDDCDSKSAPDISLFGCFVTAASGDCGELAFVVSVDGCKLVLLGACGVV